MSNNLKKFNAHLNSLEFKNKVYNLGKGDFFLS